MASAIAKKPCAKCNKGAGVATCDGCQQSFCIKHFGEHRQELSHQMDSIGQEHDLLQRDLNQQNTEHPLLSRINTWEKESMIKIQVAAEAARSDLRELLDNNKKGLKKSVNKLTDELQSSRESDDYTELDINKWVQHLRALRQELESPLTVYVADDDNAQSSIHLIKVCNQQQQHRSSDFTIGTSNNQISSTPKPSSFPHERFTAIDRKVTLSEEGLVATCSTDFKYVVAVIDGCNRYSSGKHSIFFRIEKIGRARIFFGIRTSSEKIERVENRGTSLYGWWDLNSVVMNGMQKTTQDSEDVTTNDQVTLRLYCDNQKIQLEHPRTERLVQLAIDLDKCPFPWKIVVKLSLDGDSVRILQ